MSKALEAYWEKEVGREITCKCGRIHHKERRAKSSVCKPCLAERAEKALSIQINKSYNQVLKMVGVKQCPGCLVIKPFAQYPTKDNRGQCRSCDNRRHREKWNNNEAYRRKRIDQNRQWTEVNYDSVIDRNRKWREENKDHCKAMDKRRREKLEYNVGRRNHLHVIKCADCKEYEVRKNSNYVRCICTKCYSKRSSMDWYYKMALTYNGLNETVNRSCQGGCGKSFNVAYGAGTIVCSDCRAKAKRRAYQQERSRRRGARVKGVSYDSYDVFKRDKWRCYLCGVKTQKKDIYADNAAEVDHVIPISKGGKDIPSNVRCSCRKCNIDKSDKLIPITGNLFCQVSEG